MHKSIVLIAGVITAALVSAGPAKAHPHVFVDGGVDFVLSDGAVLEALEVTWLYDEFETLYMIAEAGLSLNAAGTLDEPDRLELVRQLSDWPGDFDGSAHLYIDAGPVPLAWPEGVDARMIDGRLQMTFTRALTTPAPLSGRSVEVAFFESTYFFAFSVTYEPEIRPGAENCAANVVHFDPETAPAGLMTKLAALDREETPEIENVGALFADRIELQCD